MKTYQDSLNQNPLEFVYSAINEYKSSEEYKWAMSGHDYLIQQNTAIMKYKKILYKITGEPVEDNISANHKCACNFFKRFCTQLNQYLLKNGVTFTDDKTKEKLGGDKFDRALRKAGKYALSGTCSYGFFNLDHVDVFSAEEFAPLWDEETGALRAGIRFWQIDNSKPLRATYFEEDGYTDFMWEKGEGSILKEKRPYQQIVRESFDGVEILDGKNYPNFPIIPLWANEEHESELKGMKEEIDAYDLIKSGFANDLDDVSQIYWILENAGGMEDMDLVKFKERMKTIKATQLDDGVKAEAHTVEIPFNAREVYLDRLEKDLYKDAMIVNMDAIANGNTVATAIRASYEPQDDKADDFQDMVIDFIDGLLALIGVKDTPTFTRSRIINQSEETQMILASAQYLDDETVIRKLPFITADEVDDIIAKRGAEEYDRYSTETNRQEAEEAGEQTEENLPAGTEGA